MMAIIASREMPLYPDLDDPEAPATSPVDDDPGTALAVPGAESWPPGNGLSVARGNGDPEVPDMLFVVGEERERDDGSVHSKRSKTVVVTVIRPQESLEG